jgi:hypothetical protein
MPYEMPLAVNSSAVVVSREAAGGRPGLTSLTTQEGSPPGGLRIYPCPGRIARPASSRWRQTPP